MLLLNWKHLRQAGRVILLGNTTWSTGGWFNKHDSNGCLLYIRLYSKHCAGVHSSDPYSLSVGQVQNRPRNCQHLNDGIQDALVVKIANGFIWQTCNQIGR